MDRVLILAFAAIGLIIANPAHADGDPAKGESFVKSRCGTCHSAAKDGGNRIGPNLFGVFGRPSGSVANFNYSAGLKALNVSWDEAHLRAWLTNPRSVVATTKMTYVGIAKPSDLDDVIAYLKIDK